jgi:hypothetical protein
LPRNFTGGDPFVFCQMLIRSLLTISIFIAVLRLGPVATGQNSEPPGKPWRHSHQARFANLSPDERQKVEAAHEAAKQDPAVQAARERVRQARKDFENTIRAAMLRADPSIQPILDKIPPREKSER